MLIELHAHTAERSPCSNIDAAALVRILADRGVQGVVLTDHHYLWGEDELAALRERAGLPPGFLLLAGQEVTTGDFGDVLVYGAKSSLLPGITLAELRAGTPRAALVWAHPYRGVRRPLVADLLHGDFDAIEVINPHNGSAANEAALRDWGSWGFVGVSGTDIHSHRLPLLFPTEFCDDLASMDDLVASIKLGRCRPTSAFPSAR